MRITPDYATAVKQAAADMFGADAVVRLFGSRADDTKRGGDVDLHIQVSRAPSDWRAPYRFIDRVEDDSGDDRKIDVIIHEKGSPLRWIDEVALRDGIIL